MFGSRNLGYLRKVVKAANLFAINEPKVSAELNICYNLVKIAGFLYVSLEHAALP
jgi:hypothetical protein